MVRAMKAIRVLALVASLFIWGRLGRSAADTSATINVQPPYEDGRPQAGFRLEAQDYGVVLRHGGGPQDCDQ